MCQDKGSTECTSDCDNCGSTTLHAPNAHKRFEKLKHAIDEQGQPIALNEQASISNK